MINKSFFLILFLLLSFSTFAQPTLQEMIDIRDDAKDFFSGNQPNPDGLEELLNAQIIVAGNDFGSWDEVVYDDTNPNNGDEDNDDISWDPMEHLQNLKALSEFYAHGIDLTPTYINPVIGQRIIIGLQYWYWYGYGTQNPQNCGGTANCATTTPCATNWWWNTIGKLREIQEIAILVYDLLAPTSGPVPTVPGTSLTLLDAIAADFPLDATDCNSSEVYTGANLTEVAVNLIIHGLLTNDGDLAEDGADALKNAVTVGDAEGIQADHSFLQHDALLYTGGYGIEFIEKHCLWARLLMNTSVEYDANQRLALYNFVLNGYRWGLVGYTSDYSTAGRYIARPYPANPKDHPVSSRIINRLEEVVVAKGEESILSPEIPDIKTALCDMTDNDETAAGRQDISGIRYFWKSDYIIHQNSVNVTSIRMCSDRTIGTESVDHENILGYWLPYGCTYIYHQGDEYTNIFPLWDWTKVPGVTCPNFLPTFNNSAGTTMTSTQDEAFVGSAGNNTYSVTAMNLNKSYTDGTNDFLLQGKKAWFNFGEEIVAIGANIKDDSGLNVYTTIQQSFYAGSHGNDPESIDHNDVAYIFPPYPGNPDGSTYSLTTGEQSGAWNDIKVGGDTDILHNDIFKAWIDHGTQTNTTPASYAYIIVPGETDASDYAQNNPVTLLHNTEFIQAVKKVEENGEVLAGIVYYPNPDLMGNFISTSVDLENGITLSTNHPCALLYDETNGQICISSPARADDLITLTIESAGATHNEDFTITIDGTEEPTTCVDISSIITTFAGNIINHCENYSSGLVYGINKVEILPVGALTNSSGNYAVSNLSGNSLILDPFRDDDYRNGVWLFDAWRIKRHISGNNPLTYYKMIAADVNKSGTIDKLDLKLVRMLALGIIDDFPDVDSWEFVNASHVLPENPFQPNPPFLPPWPFPQTASTDDNDINFIGIKMGDVMFCNNDPIILVFAKFRALSGVEMHEIWRRVV